MLRIYDEKNQTIIDILLTFCPVSSSIILVKYNLINISIQVLVCFFEFQVKVLFSLVTTDHRNIFCLFLTAKNSICYFDVLTFLRHPKDVVLTSRLGRIIVGDFF